MAADTASLSRIIAYARAGALDHAWSLFVSSGAAARADDPQALSIKGRLLKDRARRCSGEERRRVYLEAAEAYAAADAIEADSYPLINAATLALLGGQAERSKVLAQSVLDRIADGSDNAETPYYREATRAEALLLSGREAEGRAALAGAIALAPRAWEDHASTIQQFALILDAHGRDSGWLDPLRPPRSLHFAGHMALAAKGPAHAAARDEIDAVLESERIGFGYGALAAGADIVIAEALLARGAELHAVLPGGVESFRARSVEPLGGDWRDRFEAVLARAETVREVAPRGALPTGTAIGLANEIAMGAALMNARRLATEAIQLLVIDGPRPVTGDGGGSAQASAVWAGSGRRQRLVRAPREVPAPPGLRAEAGGPDAVLAAVVMVELQHPGLADGPAAAALGEALRRVDRALAGAEEQLAPPQLQQGQLLIALAMPTTAAAAIARLRECWPDGTAPRMGADYGICFAIDDPFARARRLHGRPIHVAAEAMRSAPLGSICVGEDFAAALEAEGGSARTEFVGELAGADEEAPVGLYALTPLPAAVR